MTPILNDIQKKKADFIMANKYAKLSLLASSEIKDLAVVWCYYSGKIEGNTYTYVETEALLKDNITSEKRYEDAKMLKNLYNTFVSEMEYINKGQNREQIDERTLFRVHRSISSELVSSEESGMLRSRAVRITGTEYVPPKEIREIRVTLNEILFNQELYNNPLEKAVYLHCNIARLQPFIDGNKRTSRMIESIAMMNADLIPVYSAKDADILHYRKGLISFYETGNYSGYADYFLNRQIERINELSLSGEPTFDLNKNRIGESDCGLEL
ncbi:Fic family protein [Bacteroides clarus]|jgi:Fic family protein|uniref:Fic family protein n=1 Tax=Bacteroides clarus TaxID=626929 RepID=UPI00397E4EEF